jgi:esterase/lipase
MIKTPIYFVPGLAAGPEIFEYLTLDPDLYELHYLSWKIPLALEETMSNYAMRMCEEIQHKNPVLIGVSFGGMMVQEMGKFVDAKKIIIISSVKNTDELPKRFQLANFTKIYKLFPVNVVANFEGYAKYFLGKSLRKKAEIYNKYLSVKNSTYLRWSIFNVLNWNGAVVAHKNLVHIHGTKDKVFPLKNITNVIEVENGTHVMILKKAKTITKHIHESLTF